jgi:hypothetical protein
LTVGWEAGDDEEGRISKKDQPVRRLQGRRVHASVSNVDTRIHEQLRASITTFRVRTTAGHGHTFTISKYGGMISTADFDFKGGGKGYRRARVARHHGHNASHVVATVFRRPAAEKWGEKYFNAGKRYKTGFLLYHTPITLFPHRRRPSTNSNCRQSYRLRRTKMANPGGRIATRTLHPMVSRSSVFFPTECRA